MSVEVVISHYCEDIDWIKNIKYPFILYSNHTLKQNNFTNRGNEANGYLKYIINNYENFPTYIIFIHGHRISYHHTGNLDEIINNLNFNKNFGTLNNRTELELIPECRYNLLIKNIDIFETFFKYKIDIENLKYYGNAQFYVHKNNILKYSKKDYIYLYNWINETINESWDIGLIFEYMWYEMFR